MAASWGARRCVGAKKIVRLHRFFLRRPLGLPTSQGRGGLGSMDSTLALGAFRIGRDAGGEGVDVNGNLVEREKGDEFGIKLLRPDRLSPVGSKK